MNDARYRASNFYIEKQSEVFPQLLPHLHRGDGNVLAPRNDAKAKSRLSTAQLCLILTWLMITAAIAIFMDVHRSSALRAFVETHSHHTYVSFAAASTSIGELYRPPESSGCTQQEVLSPSTIVGALTIPPREVPGFWDRLGLRHEGDDEYDTSWTFQGASGQVGMRLSSDSFSLSRITLRSPTLDGGQSPSCAPRDGILWGILNQDANFTNATDAASADDFLRALPVGVPLPLHDERDTILPIALIRYNRYKSSPEQVFQVCEAANTLGLRFGVVVVQILSNWGGETTCIDRMHVEGCE